MSTKERILSAAVGKFADHGFDGTSLREVLREAGVNSALGHYHFGSKQELYYLVIRRFLEPVCAQRRALLASIGDSLPRETQIRALLHGYVSPHLSLCADPQAWDYVRLVARINTEPRTVVKPVFAELTDPVRQQYLRTLARICGRSPRDALLRQQFGFAVLLMAGAPVDLFFSTLGGTRHRAVKVRQLTERVVDVATAGVLSALQQESAGASGWSVQCTAAVAV